MKTLYIFSLGNPTTGKETKYKYTRHNAARVLCDAFDFESFSEKYNKEVKKVEVKEDKKLENTEEIRIGTKESIKIEYIVPDCFMNLSGKFILDYIKYKNIEANNVVIAYDDIDINFGDIKISYGRNSGGHNGVESVIQNLNTKDFYRVRVGIGEKPIKEMLLQDYVLSKLSEEEVKTLGGNEKKEKLEVKLKELLELVK